mgnify:CR=1 FL=1
MSNIIEDMRSQQIRTFDGSSIYRAERITIKEYDFVIHRELGYVMFEAQLDGDGNPVIRLVTEPLSADKMLAHGLITEEEYDEFVAECARKNHEKLEEIEFKEYLRLSQKFGPDINKAIKTCLSLYDSLVSLKTGESEPS